jgi:Predicted 3'-5' exonuclease related to the exonuclease domain of PolB
MIPRDYITEWRSQAPWVQDIQVEQDCRALVEIFTHPMLSTYCVFLRYEMVRGDLTPAHLDTSMNSLRATVQKHAERRPLLSEFLK